MYFICLLSLLFGLSSPNVILYFAGCIKELLATLYSCQSFLLDPIFPKSVDKLDVAVTITDVVLLHTFIHRPALVLSI